MLAPSSAATDGVRAATTVTFYLAPVLLIGASHGMSPRVTGALVWVRREGHAVSLPPTVSPAVVVHAVSAESPTEYVELVPHFHASDPLLHHIGIVLQVAANMASPANQLYAEVLTNALAVHFLQRYVACMLPVRPVTSGLTPAMLRRTIAYIHAHLEDDLPLAVLAALVQMSPNHFARRFKQATGQTPHHYVLESRIARAKQLLAETALPLSAIGFQVGWPDQSYFTALFRKHVAMTPKAYRTATHRT
jgi:AraC family transcriptional regulator